MARSNRKPLIGFGILCLIITIPSVVIGDAPFRPLLVAMIVLSHLTGMTILSCGYRIACVHFKRELNLLHFAAIFVNVIPFIVALIFDLYSPVLATYLVMFALYMANMIHVNLRVVKTRR